MIHNRDLREQFDREGYIKLKGAFSAEEIDDLKAKIDGVAEKQCEDQLDRGALKFNSNLFRASKDIQAFLMKEQVISAVRAVAGRNTWVRWDQCITKKPGGGEFPWHQDNAYNRLLDGHFQMWVGITDQTEENGGLWMRPGSHRLGHLPHRQDFNHKECEVSPGEEVFVGSTKGDLIIFSSLMLHHTKTNNSNEDRCAYVAEFMRSDHLDPFVRGPYFVALEHGLPVGQWRNSYAAQYRPSNYVRYLPIMARMARGDVRDMLGRWGRAIPLVGDRFAA